MDEQLKKLGVKSLIPIGVSNQVSLHTTSSEAYFLGYNVVIPQDCIITDSKTDLNSTLEWLKLYFGIVSTCDEVCNYLQAHDDFEKKNIEIP